MNKWQALVNQPNIILADGAMGTLLMEAGLLSGHSPVAWNTENPAAVRRAHRDYLQAGSKLLLTNTFTGNRYRLKRHGLAERTVELNRVAAELLCAEVNAAGNWAVVAGDIGPTGELMAPLGSLTFEDAVAVFAEEAGALIAGGVDVIWIETMSDLEEAHAAIEGTRQVAPTIPIIATMSFDTRGRTMMGVKPEQAAHALIDWGAVAIGGNCGNGPEELLAVIQKMHVAAPDALLVAKPNAGKPEMIDGKTVFRATPEMMATAAQAIRDAGARVIGGCCGSTPAHLRAMASGFSMAPLLGA